MTSLAAVLRAATARLEDVTDTPRLDAELLLAHALGLRRSQLLSRLSESPSLGTFDALLARRLASEPVAYILGDCEFFSIPLSIRPPILIPRPETEHLVEVALEYAGKDSVRVLDLCTGSGCVAIAIAKHAPQGTTVHAVDINPEAVHLARENAAAVGVAVRVDEGDLFTSLDEGSPAFDIITSNPPYVEVAAWAGLAADIREYESPLALLAGEDGLEIVRRIVADARPYLRPGGQLAMEIGETQYPAVAKILEEAGYVRVSCTLDLAGIERIAVGYRPE